MHRSKDLLECMAEKFLSAAAEVKKDGDWEDMVLLAQMAEGFNEIYEACCVAKKLKTTDYDMEHHMHGGHEMDFDYDGEDARGARRYRGAYSEARRYRHAIRDGYDYDMNGNMTEEARRRRAMRDGERYVGEANVTDANGRNYRVQGDARVNTGVNSNGNLR